MDPSAFRLKDGEQSILPDCADRDVICTRSIPQLEGLLQVGELRFRRGDVRREGRAPMPQLPPDASGAVAAAASVSKTAGSGVGS